MTEPRPEQLDNPAARVEAVLMRAKPFADGSGTALDGWREVFEVETEEDVALFTAEFITQIRLAREAIERLPAESEIQNIYSNTFLFSIGSLKRCSRWPACPCPNSGRLSPMRSCIVLPDVRERSAEMALRS